MMTLPIIASCNKQEKKNAPSEANATEQVTEKTTETAQVKEQTESQEKAPEFAKLFALINTVYDSDGSRPSATDPGTGMKRIVYESDTDDEEGIEYKTIVFGKGTKAVKKQKEDYTDWVFEADDAHACYVSFHFDTDNGAIIAFKDKADAEACARQMKPLIQQDETDKQYGAGTIDSFYIANVEPRQDENGWWTFDFHAG